MRAEDFVRYLDGAREGGSGWNARCPSHDDRSASLTVSEGDDGRVLVHCHAGCSAEDVVRSVGFELRHLYPGVEPEPTLEELAEHKALHPDVLRRFNVHELDAGGGIGIPYYDTNGVFVAEKRRTALVAKEGSRWPAGQSLLAYGAWLWQWFAQTRWLVLVEGESDAWSCWAHNFPALGIPGATCVRSTLGADLLQHVERIFVVQEPDDAGQVFVRGVRQVIEETGWAGTAHVVRLDGAKDVNELLKQHPADFPQVFQAALATAPLLAEATAEQGDAEWPDPAPLTSAAVLPAFDPASLLPSSLGPWIGDTAALMGAPPEFVAVAAMVALGGIVGRRMTIRPRQHTDWTVVPNLWGVLVGPPGDMKSPALRAGLEPINRIDEQLREADAAASSSREFDQLVLKERRDDVARRIRETLRAGQDVTALRSMMANLGASAPAVRQLIVSDSTAEKLIEILAANPEGIILHRDELTGWLSLLEREGREGERKLFLESWSGDEPHTVARIGRGVTHVRAACISVIGTIQPGPFARHIRTALAGGDGNDGLVQRFQLAVYPDHDPQRRAIDRPPDAAAKVRAFDVYQRMYGMRAEGYHAQREGDAPPYLRFDAAAQARFNAWYDGLEAKLRAGEASPALLAHLSKYRSLVPSLALLVHLADVAAGMTPPGPVGENAVRRAVAWAELLEAHARRIYGSAIEDFRPARLLADHLVAGELGSEFTAREVYRHHWTGLKGSDSVDAAAEELIEAGWLRRRTEGTGGQAKTIFVVNPKVRR